MKKRSISVVFLLVLVFLNCVFCARGEGADLSQIDWSRYPAAYEHIRNEMAKGVPLDQVSLSDELVTRNFSEEDLMGFWEFSGNGRIGLIQFAEELGIVDAEEAHKQVDGFLFDSKGSLFRVSGVYGDLDYQVCEYEKVKDEAGIYGIKVTVPGEGTLTYDYLLDMLVLNVPFFDLGYTYVKTQNYEDFSEQEMSISQSGTTAQAEAPTKEELEAYAPGKTVTIGALRGGDNDIPIEWIVLEQKDDMALLLSKAPLGYSRYEDITDTLATIHQHLFSNEERGRIEIQYKTILVGEGELIPQKLFLLTKNEVERYLPNKDDRACQYDGMDEPISWWTRTPYEIYKDCVTIVYKDNDFLFGEEDSDYYYVRPAMWVHIGERVSKAAAELEGIWESNAVGHSLSNYDLVLRMRFIDAENVLLTSIYKANDVMNQKEWLYLYSYSDGIVNIYDAFSTQARVDGDQLLPSDGKDSVYLLYTDEDMDTDSAIKIASFNRIKDGQASTRDDMADYVGRWSNVNENSGFLREFTLDEDGSVILYSEDVHSEEELSWYVENGKVILNIYNRYYGSSTYYAYTPSEDRSKLSIVIDDGSAVMFERKQADSVFEYVEREDGLHITGFSGEAPEELVIPEKINGKPVAFIESKAFAESNIRSVVFEAPIELGEGVFKECHYLESVTLPKGIECIPAETFYRCMSLVNIILPEGIQRLETFAFGGCYDLESIYLPDGITYISENAFASCQALKELKLPEGITEFSYLHISGCFDLTDVYLPRSVVSIISEDDSILHVDKLSDMETKVTFHVWIGSYAQEWMAQVRYKDYSQIRRRYEVHYPPLPEGCIVKVDSPHIGFDFAVLYTDGTVYCTDESCDTSKLQGVADIRMSTYKVPDSNNVYQNYIVALTEDGRVLVTDNAPDYEFIAESWTNITKIEINKLHSTTLGLDADGELHITTRSADDAPILNVADFANHSEGLVIIDKYNTKGHIGVYGYWSYAAFINEDGSAKTIMPYKESFEPTPDDWYQLVQIVGIDYYNSVALREDGKVVLNHYATGYRDASEWEDIIALDILSNNGTLIGYRADGSIEAIGSLAELFEGKLTHERKSAKLNRVHQAEPTPTPTPIQTPTPIPTPTPKPKLTFAVGDKLYDDNFEYTMTEDGLFLTGEREDVYLDRITVPENLNGYAVTGVDMQEIGNYDSLYLSSSVAHLGDGRVIKRIRVSPDNPYFSATLHTLLSKNGKTLLKVFCSGDNLILPETVEIIAEDAFADAFVSRIYVRKGNTCFRVIDGSLYSADGSVLYYVPSSVGNFTAADTLRTVSKFALAHLPNQVILNEGITFLDGIGELYLYSDEKIIYLPASLEEISPDGLIWLSNFNEIEVSQDNLNFASENGMLYTKDRKTLLVQRTTESMFDELYDTD